LIINYFNKKTMPNLTNAEKAQLYNDMLLRYTRLQEEIRRIKADNFELKAEDQKKVNLLESQMKKIFNDTQRLYN